MDKSYLAGFIDGEGSIIIKPPRVRIYISNTNKEVLEKIRKFTRCGSSFEVKRKIKKNWKKQYGWTICNHKDCLRILKWIEKYLIIKKELCKEAISYIENKRWQKDYISKKELMGIRRLSSRKAGKKLGVSAFSILRYRKKYGLD